MPVGVRGKKGERDGGHKDAADLEHERRERHDPEERIAELGSCCHVGCPVAWVDEADGHEKARADMPEYFEAAMASGMRALLAAPDMGLMIKRMRFFILQN